MLNIIIFSVLLLYCLPHPVLSQATPWVSSGFGTVLESVMPGTFQATGLSPVSQD